ncbi:hypothetical protein DFH09DRAFT_1034497 [Mycena vulgaris]|nr:hypothetical protein DFH09DRAFT_1034497 [Mycena vulgaris]
MSLEASIFATRYVPGKCSKYFHAFVNTVPLAVGTTALLYDHVLTIGDEVKLIWRNSAAGPMNRIGFTINRYITEAMAIYVAYSKCFCHTVNGVSSLSSAECCRDFIWVHSIAATVFIALSHFILMSRVYTLWDRRPLIKWILMGAFGVAISIAMVFAILAAHQVQSDLVYNPNIHMCEFSKKPPALTVMLGAMTALDLFLIVMTIFNALDRPYQKQAEVMTALQHDGARMFAALFVLRLASLIMAIVGSPAYCFVTLTVVWTMCSVVTSRIQLGVEGLRFIRFTAPPGSELELSGFINTDTIRPTGSTIPS